MDWYLYHSVPQICTYRPYTFAGLADSTVASEQKGPGFDTRLGQDLSMWSLHVLPAFAWVPFRCPSSPTIKSVTLTCTKYMQIIALYIHKEICVSAFPRFGLWKNIYCTQQVVAVVTCFLLLNYLNIFSVIVCMYDQSPACEGTTLSLLMPCFCLSSDAVFESASCIFTHK